jgi:hypothetical protein
MSGILDLIRAYHHCAEVPRLRQMALVVEQLATQLRLDLAHIQAKQSSDSPPLRPVIVWYESPLDSWDIPTYAVFLTSCITTFFNPECILEATDDEGQMALTPEYVALVRDQFSRFLLYIHRESDALAAFLKPLWQYERPEMGPLRESTPELLYERLMEVWNLCLDRCTKKMSSKEDAPQLAECIMEKNLELMQEGLQTPPVLTWMLMHYYTSKLNTMTGDILAKRTAKKVVIIDFKSPKTKKGNK